MLAITEKASITPIASHILHSTAPTIAGMMYLCSLGINNSSTSHPSPVSFPALKDASTAATSPVMRTTNFPGQMVFASTIFTGAALTISSIALIPTAMLLNSRTPSTGTDIYSFIL